jgi:hypothetical protein
MSTATTATYPDPTAPRYQCGSGCGTLTFSWGRRMPENGRLGTVSLGQFVNKPIQVFDAKELRDSNNNLVLTDWGFQAQDGSFLGRMIVSARQSYIRFAHFRANDQWPQVTCSVPRPDPLDPRDPIDKYV